MRAIAVVLVVASALAGCGKPATTTPGAKADGETSLLRLAPEQKISLRDAIATAKSAAPGTPIAAGMESAAQPGASFVGVVVLDAKRNAVEVRVNPADGKLVSAGPHAEDVRGVDPAAVASALPAQHLALEDLVSRAEKETGARAVRIRLVAKDGRLVARARTFDGKTLHTVTLDPVSGGLATPEAK